MSLNLKSSNHQRRQALDAGASTETRLCDQPVVSPCHENSRDRSVASSIVKKGMGHKFQPQSCGVETACVFFV